MAFFDLPLPELEKYCPQRNEPDDFDVFWQKTMLENDQSESRSTFEKVTEPLEFVDVFDVTFAGYGNQPIKAWLLLPRGTTKPIPCVVDYVGYGGGRGKPLERLQWVNAGFANFIMDTRGQGSSWSQGDTPDLETKPSNSQFPGFMTRGILSPYTYYYRRVFLDAICALKAARSHPLVDSERVAVNGGSQGGGIAIAAAGLVPDVPLAFVDVPFLCHFERAVQLVNSDPYHEIVNFLRVHRDKEQTVFKTLSYFDGLNFASRAQAKTIFSTALMDETCPPSTVFAAYNYWAGEKEMKVYPYNEHDGGGIHHLYYKINYLRGLWM